MFFRSGQRPTDQNIDYVEMKRALSYWENINWQIICHSKFMSTASLIHVSNDLIHVANKEFFNFIWKGKDKIKRFALIHDIAVWRVKDA